MAVVQVEGGRKVAGVQKLGEELGKFWDSIMTSPDVTVPECEEFIRGMNPPKMWTEPLPKLWRRLSEDIVLTALEGLDPTSAPGEDGIPAALYHASMQRPGRTA